jgi:hypothetical protein
MAMIAEEEIVFALDAEALPFGLGGFEYEGIEKGVFDGVLIAVEPGIEEQEPVAFAFVEQNEGLGAHAVTDGVAGGDGSAFGTDRAGVAGATFFDFGVIDGGIREILVVRKHSF